MTFDLIAECDSLCSIEIAYNDWITMTYLMEPEMLCEAPAMIPAHLEWLRSRIADQELDILNPVYR